MLELDDDLAVLRVRSTRIPNGLRRAFLVRPTRSYARAESRPRILPDGMMHAVKAPSSVEDVQLSSPAVPCARRRGRAHAGQGPLPGNGRHRPSPKTQQDALLHLTDATRLSTRI